MILDDVLARTLDCMRVDCEILRQLENLSLVHATARLITIRNGLKQIISDNTGFGLVQSLVQSL